MDAVSSSRPQALSATNNAGTALVCGEHSTSGGDAVRLIMSTGWECVVAHEVERASWLASVRNFRLIVLLGDSLTWTGEALARVSARTDSPIIVVFSDPTAQARLLDMGADMVLEEGCDDALFRSTIRAVVRRAPSSTPELRYLEADGLRLDLWSRAVYLHDSLLDLSPTEFELLHHLMTRAQMVLRHHDIIKAVWGWKYTAEDRNALRIHINRLRRKIDDALDQPRYIRSLRGIGYYFVQPVSEFADGHDALSTSSGREGTDLLLQGHLGNVSRTLWAAASREQACADLVDMVVSEGLCDAAAVLATRPRSDALHLVAQSGMSSEWVRVVEQGVPLGQKFLASDTVNSHQVRNYVDIRKLSGRYGPTVRLLREAELPVILSIPLVNQHGVWGQMGCARRSDSAFTPAHCMLLEAAARLLGAQFADETTGRAAAS